jgi:hypothetical protein
MNDYDDFINRFSVRNIEVSREPKYSSIHSYYSTATYYDHDHREQIIDIEINRSGFEELVRLNRKFDNWSREARAEEYLRRQHPTLNEVYEKYQMLLALYK